MTITEQVNDDIKAAMKAGERERTQALRLVLSELQKDAKEGRGDELAVLRRERKRRLESATTYREAGRDELADAEEAEAQMIEAYLPTLLTDAKLGQLIAEAIAATGASSQRDMGAVMKHVMAAAKGAADGKRVSELVRGALASK